MCINHLSTNTFGISNLGIDFKILSFKLAPLLALLSGQKVGTLYKFVCSLMQVTENKVAFHQCDKLMKSRSTLKIKTVYHAYPYNKNLYPIAIITTYRVSAKKRVPSLVLSRPIVLQNARPAYNSILKGKSFNLQQHNVTCLYNDYRKTPIGNSLSM